MRVLLQEQAKHDDRRVRLAIEVFCYRARKYIGAFLACMGGADAVVFTGGIGENSPEIRDRKSTRLNSSHGYISYAVFCLKKKKELIEMNTVSIVVAIDRPRLAEKRFS